MAGKQRKMKLHVEGVRRAKPDARRVAKAIMRLAVELDAGAAEGMAEVLEHEEALQRRALVLKKRGSGKDAK
jgi:hypothetical protein